MAPVAAGATVIAREQHDDGVSVDTIFVADTPHSLATVEIGAGAGVYDLRVRQPGYVDWLRTGVTVRAVGDCDFERVTVTALLQLRAL